MEERGVVQDGGVGADIKLDDDLDRVADVDARVNRVVQHVRAIAIALVLRTSQTCEEVVRLRKRTELYVRRSQWLMERLVL